MGNTEVNEAPQLLGCRPPVRWPDHAIQAR